MDSCLTLRNELLEKAYLLTKQETYWEEASGWRVAGSGNPEALLCHVARGLRFYGHGISFQVVWLIILLAP